MLTGKKFIIHTLMALTALSLVSTSSQAMRRVTTEMSCLGLISQSARSLINPQQTQAIRFASSTGEAKFEEQFGPIRELQIACRGTLIPPSSVTLHKNKTQQHALFSTQSYKRGDLIFTLPLNKEGVLTETPETMLTVTKEEWVSIVTRNASSNIHEYEPNLGINIYRNTEEDAILIGFFASKDIKKGDELALDYNSNYRLIPVDNGSKGTTYLLALATAGGVIYFLPFFIAGGMFALCAWRECVGFIFRILLLSY